MSDRWATWLAERRFGGSEDVRVDSGKLFDEFRRRVLEGAQIESGDVVLDVGCGEGLIGFGALELVGDDGRVVFSDFSADVLEVCRKRAEGDGRCEFLVASADDLALADGSVDVLTTRSVVIYLDDKASALREFFRVLRPGGRLSMFEPVNDFAYPEPEGIFAGYDVRDVWDVVEKVRRCYDDATPTFHGWDERDLLRWTEEAGFADVELTLEIEVKSRTMMDMRDWEAFRQFAPNPLAPTLQEAMDDRLNHDEQARLVGHLRPLVESGRGGYRMASAYVRAVKG